MSRTREKASPKHLREDDQDSVRKAVGQRWIGFYGDHTDNQNASEYFFLRINSFFLIQKPQVTGQ